MSTPTKRHNVYLPIDLIEWMTTRAERHAEPVAVASQVVAELSTWREHLRVELASTIWPLGEINLIADVCNGVLIGRGVDRSITWDVTEALDQHPGSYGAKHGADEDALRARLERLGPTANHALAHAVDSWCKQHLEPTADGWAKVGVRVAPEAP